MDDETIYQVQILKDDKWVNIELEETKKGDIFRWLLKDGTPVEMIGGTIFKSTKDFNHGVTFVLYEG